MIRLPIFILLWAGMLAIKIPVAFLGLAVVPLMHRYRHDNYSSLPWWTRPWANIEDWHGQMNSHQYSLPRWYVDKHGIGFRQFYRYHAIRNPAAGLRSFEWLDLDITPHLVEYWTPQFFAVYEPHRLRNVNRKSAGYFAWQGWRAGMKFIHIWNNEHHLVLKLGWRVEPNDVSDTDVSELDRDSSFATKFLPYRKG